MTRGKRTATLASFLSVFALVSTSVASAHVVVRPGEATPDAYTTFTASVPNEKDVPVTGLRLVIPKGVESVTPTVKQGWQIDTKESDDEVTEISWTGSTIDAGLRDEFTFSAKTPAKDGDLQWKAYQSYGDGSVVAWDQEPTDDHGHGDEDKGPYSVTVVSDDAEEVTVEESSDTDASTQLAFVFSIAALALSAVTLIRVTKK